MTVPGEVLEEWVTVYVADGPPDVVPVVVRIDAPQPRFATLADQAAAYQEQAGELELHLTRALPGGLYDALLRAMLARRASHFRVPFTRPGE